MTAPRILGGRPDRASFAFDGSIAVAVGDLMWQDTNDVKPASSVSDQGSEALNQAYFAPKFAGVSNKGRLAAETAADTDFPVLTDVVVEMDCASDTFEVGDKVTIDEAASGTALENQKLVKTGNESLAIGYAMKRYGSATTRVLVRLLSRLVVNDAMTPDVEDEVASLTTPVIIFDGATGENEIRVPTNLADALSLEIVGVGDVLVLDTSTGAVLLTVTPEVHFNGGIQLNDSDNVTFGTGDDVTLRWDGTDLDMLAAADDSVFKIGNGTNSFDVWWYGDTASDRIVFDASAKLVDFDGIDLQLKDADILHFGDTIADDARIVFDGTRLVITPLAVGGVMHIGDAADTEGNQVHVFDGGAEKPGALVLYDAGGNAMYLWVDTTGDLRIHSAYPTDEDMDGTVVGSMS